MPKSTNTAFIRSSGASSALKSKRSSSSKLSLSSWKDSGYQQKSDTSSFSESDDSDMELETHAQTKRQSSGIDEGAEEDDSYVSTSSSDCMIALPKQKSKKRSKTTRESSDVDGGDDDRSIFSTDTLPVTPPLSTIMSSDAIETTAEKEGRESSASPEPPEGHWEIEKIIDYVKDDFGELYLVKWKDWDECFNTWEPRDNLVNCLDELIRFRSQRQREVQNALDQSSYIQLLNGKRRRKGPKIPDVPPDPRPLDERIKEFWKHTHTHPEEKELKRVYKRWIDNKYLNNTRLSKSMVDKLLEGGMEGTLTDEDFKMLWKELNIIHVETRANRLKTDLKDWEQAINKITLGKPFITIENTVDLTGPPDGFEFVNDYIAGEGVVIPKDPPVGCSCVNGSNSCYDSRDSCCASEFGYKYAYTRFKKVNVLQGSPIYECNSKCQCGPDCPNRVVQDGKVDHKFCVFRTSNNRGWGVKTLKGIKKGSFVTLYVGEVIKSEEANRRGKFYDETGFTYLFDLDFNDPDNFPYSVDASKYGNVSHFINHSCMPNLGVYNVWTDCLDPNLPKIALFALKDISRGEELTFDYDRSLAAECRSKTRSDDVDDNRPAHKRVLCLCGTPKCRKYIF